MKKTVLALAVIGFSGAAAAAQSQISLSEVPPGAIHAPGIGPGYIFPTADRDSAMGSSTMPATSMMPGTIVVPDYPDTGMSQARALAILRQQGFTNVHNLRPGPDGAWHGLVVQRGGMAPVTIDRDGVVSLRQQ
jgi:hypothetical protein